MAALRDGQRFVRHDRVLLQDPPLAIEGTIGNEMDSTLSTTEAARGLNTTLPRVHRSLSRLGIGTYDGHRRKLTYGDFKRLQADLGFVPDREDIGREELLVLAALRQHSLGLRSARAVARVAGVSPTTASRALARLGNKGYVVHPLRRVVEGTVKEVELWEINWSAPVWRSVESDVRRAVLPARVAADHASSSPPKYLDHLFWNVDRPSLNLDSDGAFIVLRVLGSLDLQGLSWLASGAISKENLRRVSRACGISPRQKDFALNLARQM